MSESHTAGFTVRWAALAAIAGATAALLGAGAVGRVYAGLPDRVTRLEMNVDTLAKELRAGRDERLIFQGEMKTAIARIEANQIAIRDLLEQHTKGKP